MNVSDDPRKWMDTNGATAVISAQPKSSIQMKSAVRPRNEPSSSSRQYRTRKYMWKIKSSENVPKNKKL